jgi:hypothetical protein
MEPSNIFRDMGDTISPSCARYALNNMTTKEGTMKLGKHWWSALLLLPAIALLLNSPTAPAQDKPQAAAPAAATPQADTASTPQLFDPLADKALLAMKQRAEELKIKGVALVAYAPGDIVQSWTSKMLVVGNLKTAPTSPTDKGSNLLGIAYSKAAEMADTIKNSGHAGRPAMTGEYGWEGGVAAKGKAGILIVAFSGGASSQDVQVSRAGLAILQTQL